MGFSQFEWFDAEPVNSKSQKEQVWHYRRPEGEVEDIYFNLAQHKLQANTKHKESNSEDGKQNKGWIT
jgi:uncharacterized protein (DUF427 family)